jgi:hypothetical protein
MRRWMLALIAIAAATPATAQRSADREQVRAAVEDYVVGFYQGDSARLVRSVSPEVSKYGYSRQQQSGEYRGMSMPYPSFMRFAQGVREGRNRPPEDPVREIVILDVQDQTACAKLIAWWGTDYLLLGREDGRWMITHVLWQSPPPGMPR